MSRSLTTRLSLFSTTHLSSRIAKDPQRLPPQPCNNTTTPIISIMCHTQIPLCMLPTHMCKLSMMILSGDPSSRRTQRYRRVMTNCIMRNCMQTRTGSCLMEEVARTHSFDPTLHHLRAVTLVVPNCTITSTFFRSLCICSKLRRDGVPVSAT